MAAWRHQKSAASTSGSPKAILATALAPGALSLALTIFQLSLPGHLLGITEYDDGVYLGAALRLVHGAVPYRDFAFVQPPGIVLLLSPVALVGHLVGEPAALAIARVLTAAVTGLDAALVARLLRVQGRLAMLVAGGALATFPLAVAADHTLLLEPYLDAFVLAGLVLACGEGGVSNRRVWLAGICFGLAGAVKLWAIFPFLALVACELARDRRRVARLTAGAAVGFGVCCLPFLLVAPGAFLREVLVDQLGRGASVDSAVPLGTRLVELVGLPGLPGIPSSAVLAATLFVLLGALLLVAFVTGRGRWGFPDNVVVLTAAFPVGGLLAGPDFYPHYAFFTAPLLAACAGIGVAGSAGAFRSWWARHRGGPVPRRARAALTAGGLALLGVLVAANVVNAGRFLPTSLITRTGAVVDPGPAIAKVVPAGACTVADDPVLAIEADRLSASSACPPLTDPYGQWLAVAGPHDVPLRPPYPPRLVALWRHDLGAAHDVILTSPTSAYVPWAPSLRRWFDRTFRPVLVERDAAVYARRHTRSSPSHHLRPPGSAAQRH